MVRVVVENGQTSEISIKSSGISAKVSLSETKTQISPKIKSVGLNSSLVNGNTLVNLVNEHNLSASAHSGLISELNAKLNAHEIEINKKINSSLLAEVATTGDYEDLSGTPDLAEVAISGDYSDLSNTPDIPSDTNDLTNGAGFITGITSTDVTNALGYTPYNSSNPNGYTSNVGTVTSVNNTSPDNNGNVSLSIPTVNNSTITITQGGVTKGSFTLNQSSGDTIALDAGGGGGTLYDGQWVSSFSELFSGSWAGNAEKTFDLSSYLPNDNYIYDVMIGLAVTTGNTSGNTLYICAYSSIIGNSTHPVEIAAANTRTSNTMVAYGYGLIPVGADRNLYGINFASAAGNVYFQVYGYRRVGTNS